MGFLLDSSCELFWESNQELQACYQFNLYTILTWSQALSTCQAQGGNLLSVTSLAEYRYIRGRHLMEKTEKQGLACSGALPKTVCFVIMEHYAYF